METQTTQAAPTAPALPNGHTPPAVQSNNGKPLVPHKVATPPGTATFPLNLFRKIQKIIAADIHVGKDGYNEFHKYEYVTEADIVDAMKIIFSKYNMAYDFDIVDVNQVLIDGKEITRVKARIVLVDLDSGEYKVNHIFGDGQDKGDKGIYKAYTGLQKYYFMKNFLISTGDDPEKDSKESDKGSKASSSGSSSPATSTRRGFTAPSKKTETKASGEADKKPEQQASAAPAATSAKTDTPTTSAPAQTAGTTQQSAPETTAETPAKTEAAPTESKPKKERARFNPPPKTKREE